LPTTISRTLAPVHSPEHHEQAALFKYQIAAGSTPTAFDASKNDLGRTYGLVLTKTW
jgi:hypothetical protein